MNTLIRISKTSWMRLAQRVLARGMGDSDHEKFTLCPKIYVGDYEISIALSGYPQQDLDYTDIQVFKKQESDEDKYTLNVSELFASLVEEKYGCAVNKDCMHTSTHLMYLLQIAHELYEGEHLAKLAATTHIRGITQPMETQL